MCLKWLLELLFGREQPRTVRDIPRKIRGLNLSGFWQKWEMAAATLHGTITNSDGVQLNHNIVVRFFAEGTDTEIHKSVCVSDATGNFYVYDAPIGTYDVGIKPQGALSNLVASQTFTSGNTTAVAFGDVNFGDLTFDDMVTAADQGVMLNHWNTAGDCVGYAGNWLIP